VSGTKAQVEFTNRDAVYKGLALATVDGAHYLYASNFRAGRIDVFNAHFRAVKLSGGFSDSEVPEGFAPFDVQLLGGQVPGLVRSTLRSCA
jgi:uncharacterized protein (TIGR03118 family)